jgi:hypothetical protein
MVTADGAGGLLKAGGKQRTDSTHVVAAVAALDRLELAGESVRAAVEALAAAHPDWLAQRICVADWNRRDGTPMTSWRPPLSKARREELAIVYARDGYALLEAVYDPSAPPWLRELPAVDVLRRVLLQNYTRTITSGGREVIRGGRRSRTAAVSRPVMPGCPAGCQAGGVLAGLQAARHRDLRRSAGLHLPAGRRGCRGPRRRRRPPPRT